MEPMTSCMENKPIYPLQVIYGMLTESGINRVNIVGSLTPHYPNSHSLYPDGPEINAIKIGLDEVIL